MALPNAIRSGDVSASRRDDGDSVHGPDWTDVREYLDYLELLSNRGVRLVLKPATGYSNRGGFRVELWLDGLPVVLGSCGFGRGYAGSAKTMAGAAYVACLKGDEALELAKAVAVAVRSPRKRRKAPKG